jgi:hypothetical protein
MRITRPRVAVAAGLIALAGTVTGTVLAAGPASAMAATPRAHQVVVVNCAGQGRVKPTQYDNGPIACMPSSEYITGLRWTSWTTVAFGGGVFKVNSCTPSCAAGKYLSYPILTVLWRARPWPHHAGTDYFSRMTLIFTGKRPGKAPVSQTWTLPST